jgi:molecular chaperone DnaK
MSYQLGVDLGTTFTCVAVHEGDGSRIIELSDSSASIPSVVFLEESGAILVGQAAARRSVLEPSRSAREFKRRFGDTTPIFVGGSPYSADALAAELLKSVYQLVTARMGGEPSATVITHPANWGSYKLELLEQVVQRADLEGVVMLSEPEAAVLNYAELERVPVGSVVAVFDLGGGTFDAAVIRKTDAGVETLGKPEGLERLGGIDLDQTVFNFVVQNLDGATDDLDMDNDATMSALARLRAECVDAKVALSSDEAVSIPVMLPGIHTSVRMTRAEFESLARPSLQSAVDALGRALRSAGVSADELTAVLLAGGSSRIPLVAEMVGSSLGRPVAVDVHPKHVVAMGAATAAAAVFGKTGNTSAVAPGSAPSQIPQSTTIAGVTQLDPGPPPPTPATASPPQPALIVSVPSKDHSAKDHSAKDYSTKVDSGGESRRTLLWIGIPAAAALVVALGAGLTLARGDDSAVTPTTIAASVTSTPNTVDLLGSKDWCAAALILNERAEEFDALDLENPVVMEQGITELLQMTTQAQQIAPPEIAADLAAVRISLATLSAALSEVKWSVLDLEPAIIESFVDAGVAPGANMDRYNFEVCGIGDDPSADPGGDSAADNLPLEGTASEPSVAAVTAAPVPQATAAPAPVATAAPAPVATAAPAPVATAAPAPVATAAPVPQTTAAPAPPPTGPGVPCGPPGPSGPSPFQNFAVNVNIPASPSLNSDLIELRDGDTISVSLVDLGGGTDPVLELFDPCGYSIAYNDDVSGASDDAGLTVVVNDFGDYTIAFQSFPGAPAGQGQLGITVN